jgi:hypothetical protein
MGVGVSSLRGVEEELDTLVVGQLCCSKPHHVYSQPIIAELSVM